MQFFYFNVQLLPVVGDGDFVGKEGYKKVFEGCNEIVEHYWEKREIEKIALESRNNFHTFKPFKITEDYASGYLKKFNQVDKLVQTYTDQTLFSADSLPASSEAYDFYFFYSFEHHILALQVGKRLPAVSVIKKIISHMLRDVSELLYPDHALSVSLLSDHGLIADLNSKASGFYNANITATFNNSFDSFSQDQKELHDELKEKGINKVQHQEKSARGGMMSGLSSFAMALLILSIPSGQATIRYLDSDTGKRESFNTDDRPVQIDVDVTEDDGKTYVSEEELNSRINVSIPRAIQKSMVSGENLNKNMALTEQENVQDAQGDMDES